jgi:hypothetical protein
MLINTKTCFPPNTRFNIIVPIKKEKVSIPVKVSRVVKEGDIYNIMGIEVLSHFNKYFGFISYLKGGEFSIPLKISDETLKQTTKCKSNFQCLTDNGNMCIVDRPVNGKALFIKERVNKNNNCLYIEFSEYSSICNCPTRYEIHMRYNC